MKLHLVPKQQLESGYFYAIWRQNDKVQYVKIKSHRILSLLFCHLSSSIHHPQGVQSPL